jgi:3-deoxy-7-phosphoheptulonate synthase
VVVVDAPHGHDQENHLRQIDVVRDLAGQVPTSEAAIRGVTVENDPVSGRQDLTAGIPIR